MAKYNIVKFQNLDKVILEHQNRYFLASFSDVPYSGPEVLVFQSDEQGNVTDWIEVDGGRGYKSLAEFITNGGLKVNIYNPLDEDTQ